MVMKGTDPDTAEGDTGGDPPTGRVSSPASTGGAGTTFEQHVGAYWLAQLRRASSLRVGWPDAGQVSRIVWLRALSGLALLPTGYTNLWDSSDPPSSSPAVMSRAESAPRLVAEWRLSLSGASEDPQGQ
jgi:hypothetical protein